MRLVGWAETKENLAECPTVDATSLEESCQRLYCGRIVRITWKHVTYR